MKRFLQSDSFKRLAAIVGVIFLGIICAAFSHNASSPFTTVLSVVFSPVQRSASGYSMGQMIASERGRRLRTH